MLDLKMEKNVKITHISFLIFFIVSSGICLELDPNKFLDPVLSLRVFDNCYDDLDLNKKVKKDIVKCNELKIGQCYDRYFISKYKYSELSKVLLKVSSNVNLPSYVYFRILFKSNHMVIGKAYKGGLKRPSYDYTKSMKVELDYKFIDKRNFYVDLSKIKKKIDEYVSRGEWNLTVYFDEQFAHYPPIEISNLPCLLAPHTN